MEKHTHYGVEVTYQITENSFKQQLRDNGIEYIDLPILYNVVKYVYDGKERFALIIPCGVEDYAEKVYITSQIPLDLNWGKLANDIDNQLYGSKNPPMEMETKAHLLCDAVEKIINEHKDAENDFWNKCMEEKEINPLEFRLVLGTLGYTVDDILEMDCSDVDTEELKRMKD